MGQADAQVSPGGGKSWRRWVGPESPAGEECAVEGSTCWELPHPPNVPSGGPEKSRGPLHASQRGIEYVQHEIYHFNSFKV